MEHIIDTTPQGSAILGYGKAPKSLGFLKWLLIGLIMVVVLVIFGGWILLRSITIELPGERMLLVALKPSDIESRLPSGLVSDLPPSWRAALRTNSSLPAYIGASLDEDGNTHAFAIVYRSHSVVADHDLQVTNSGFLRLLEDVSSNTERDRVPLSELFSLSRKLRSHDASWQINARELVRFALDEEASNGTVRGTWDGRYERIELPKTNVLSVADVGAPILVTLGSDRDEAALVTDALASQGIDLRAVETPPSVIFLSPNEGDVRLGWDQTLPPKEQSLALGALGLASPRDYELPDETIVREMTLESEERMAESGSLFSSEGISGIPLSDMQPSDCIGNLRLSIDGQALQNLLISWNIPKSLRENLVSVQIRETENVANVCINETISN